MTTSPRNATDMSPAESHAMNAGAEHIQAMKVFDIEMSESGSGGFHIKNNPQHPYQRSQVIQRTGSGVDIRCTLVDVTHGAMSRESDFWASILVFQFRFDPQKQTRRICEASIELTFDVVDLENELPEVDAISFDGNYSFLPSTRSETLVTGAGVGAGASFGAELNASLNWEKTITHEISTVATINGGKLVKDNIGFHRIAKWTLLEDETKKSGVPASIQVAVRLKRRDNAVYTCIPELKCKADKWTSVKSFFGRVPEDDPVLLKPDLEATSMLKGYDAEELGSIDLETLGDVTVTTMIENAIKSQAV
ncbi:intracellular serine protease [Fusarium napiforme]|uniref:Intracellular serine protease n=1 Tax=Fusarium napiforme TaxID=42672 RepID=A0A8H5JWB6_9HYPO|nr:intracellular serine protease [Fusarium napiforme]